MNALEHALGARATRTAEGLRLNPSSARELGEVLQVLKDAKVRLHHDVTLSRGALAQVGPVHELSMTISAGAGATLAAVEAALRVKNLSLGPLTPGAWGLDLGAFLEGPYAGLRAIPGGRLEPLCVQLEGVLADGRLVRTMPGPRNATGPDLAALFLGGGGRLALVASAVLRALPVAPLEDRGSYAFSSAAKAVDFVRQVLADGALPTAAALRCADGHCFVELTFAGIGPQLERERATAHRAQHASGGLARGQAVPGADQPSRAPTALPTPGALELESTWPQVERALEAGHPLELFRLCLGTVVARGQVEGLRLDATAAGWGAAGALAAGLDPHGVLGGLP